MFEYDSLRSSSAVPKYQMSVQSIEFGRKCSKVQPLAYMHNFRQQKPLVKLPGSLRSALTILRSRDYVSS